MCWQLEIAFSPTFKWLPCYRRRFRSLKLPGETRPDEEAQRLMKLHQRSSDERTGGFSRVRNICKRGINRQTKNLTRVPFHLSLHQHRQAPTSPHPEIRPPIHPFHFIAPRCCIQMQHLNSVFDVFFVCPKFLLFHLQRK